ncbi:MAG: serine/threonine-protein kinase [candidate division Zixibacteria bacterium]|nr:serine/threonine-protein kinase [candidate division Zixibacteria bacterium]
MSVKQSFVDKLLGRFKSGILYWLLTLLVLVIYVQNLSPLEKLELKIEDKVRATRTLQPDKSAIAIVAIDSRSIDQVGKWPWDHSRLSDLLITICDYKPKAVMLDIALTERVQEYVRGHSSQLAQSISECGNVIEPFDVVVGAQGNLSRQAPEYMVPSSTLPAPDMSLDDLPKAIAAFVPPGIFASKARAVGFRFYKPDSDDKMRFANLMINYDDKIYFSTPLQLANAYLGNSPADLRLSPDGRPILGGRPLPVDKGGRMMVNLPADSLAYPMFSAIDILTGDADRNLVSGKAIVLAVTIPEVLETFETGTVGTIPAYNFYAATVQNLISSTAPSRLHFPIPVDLLLILAIGVFGGLVLPRIALMYRLIALFILGFIIVNINFVLFSTFNVVTNILYPTMTVLFFLGISFAVKSIETPPAPKRLSKGIDLRKLLGDGPIAVQRQGDREIDFDEIPARILRDEPLAPEVFEETIRLDFEAMRRGEDLIPASEYAKHDKSSGRVKATPLAPVTSDLSLQEPATRAFIPDLLDVDMSRIPPPEVKADATQPASTRQPTPEEELTLTPEEKQAFAVRFSTEGQPVSFGRYQVIEPLGMGAMGTVYKGKDPSIDRLVALKTIRLDAIADPSEINELKERLLREAKAAGNLSHPNIVTIYDFGLQGNLQYIAMEYIDGYTLESVLKRNLHLNYRIIASTIIQVCSALEYAHKMGIIHRDIKPANIMVMENFRVKVMDFGIAHFKSSSMTQTGIAMGTPNYISPEQLKGKEVTPSSDIFSLGVVLYELLTHIKPFTAENISALVYKITNENPPPPSTLDPKVPPLFDLVLKKSLAKDPAERYRSAKEMANALEDFTVTLGKKPAMV